MVRISRDRLRRFAQHIRSLHHPLVLETDLAVCFILTLRDHGDLERDIQVSEIRSGFHRFRDALVDFGGLEPFSEAGNIQGYLVGMSAQPTAEEAFCLLDPFSYISHLSAMAWHGLTDRMPKTLFATRPSAKLWRSLSDARLANALGDLTKVYLQAKLPVYRAVDIGRISKRPLNIWRSSRLDHGYQAAFKHVEGRSLRVATAARCFLDMVREPNLCGGIYHVIEVFEEHAPAHREQILSELDRHGNKLECARVGYLLERSTPEAAPHPILERWAAGATRGGSRKLDPAGDYADTYSERWALSLNV